MIGLLRGAGRVAGEGRRGAGGSAERGAGEPDPQQHRRRQRAPARQLPARQGHRAPPGGGPLRVRIEKLVLWLVFFFFFFLVR